MPNSIKYSTTGDTLSIKKGNFFFGVGDVGKGPSNATGHYQGISPPSNGYTIYSNTSGSDTSIFCANNDLQLINFTNGFYFTVTNYISNGGNFADGTISPFNTPYNNTGGISQVVSISDDQPYVGSQSKNALYLNYNGGRMMGTTNLLTTGVTYTFSFWAKVISGTTMSVTWNNQNGSGETNAWTSGAVLTTQWQRYTQTFVYNLPRTRFYFYTFNTSNPERAAIFTEFQVTTGSTYGPPSLQNVNECLRWYGAVPTNLVCVNRDYEPVNTNGLVFNIDAGFTPSYPTTGTTWYDISYSGNNGTLINGPTFNSGNGGSIVFDGTDDFISTNVSPTALGMIGGNFTVCCWFYCDNLSITNGGLVNSQTANSAGNTYEMGVRFNSLWVGFYGGDQYIGIQNNTWYYSVHTYNFTTKSSKLYVNGVLGSTTTRTVDLSSTANIRIGVYGSNNSEFLGKISVVQIYNRELSQTEVSQNFNAQKSRFGL